jgi:predicted dehydrogenase
MTVRIGVIGTKNGHAAIIAGYLNGWSESAPTPVRAGGYLDPFYHFWQYQRPEETMESGSPDLGGHARVTKIWSPDSSAARAIAAACDIDEVSATIEDASTDVDAVMVLSGEPEEHPRQAGPALERGLPTFIDKPLGSDIHQCQEMYAQAARGGAPLFSGSGLRWSAELKVAKQEFVSGYGERIEGIYVKVPNRMDQYGIHAVEMANVVLGADVRCVKGFTAGNRATAVLEYGSGQTAVIETLYAQVRPSYCVVVYGQRHTKMYHLYDTSLPFIAMFQDFVKMATEGTVPVPEQEVLRMMTITFAAEQACSGGGDVQLPPYPG